MASFDDAIPTVLRHEGGFENNPNDSGSATNFGVSLRWLKSQGLLAELEAEEGDKTQDEVKIIRDMTQAQACGFFKAFWWDKYQYGNFNSQALATKTLDVSVNMGSGRSHRILQGVLGLVQDGVLGAKSFAEANAVSPSVTLVKFQAAQAQFYRDLVTKNPRLQEFLNGWLNRAFDRN
jgi:lysozyme family protein